MKDLVKDTIGKIKKEKIKPIPKWRFILDNFILWASFFFLVCFGAISFAIIIRFASDLDWSIYKYLSGNFVKFFLTMIPYIWLVLFAIFLIFALLNFRKTKKGYRYNWFAIGGLVLVLSIGLGLLVRVIGVEEKLNNVFIKKIPPYEKMIHNREKGWLQPARGVIPGEIITIDNDEITLRDPENNLWDVIFEDNTIIREDLGELREGEKVIVIGEIEKENTIRAKIICPLRQMKPKRKFFLNKRLDPKTLPLTPLTSPS